MRLEDLRIFVTVAEAGSLSGGARRVGLSVATVARRIDALETWVGTPLMRRGSAGVFLSDAGNRLLAAARLAMDRVGEVERLGEALRMGAPEPPVRISATEPVIAQVLSPALPRLFAAGPITIEFITSTAIADFDRHDCDVAVRLVRPTGDALVAKRMPDIVMGLFASEAYLGGRDPERLVLSEERLLVMSGAHGRIAEVEWVTRQRLDAAAAVLSSSSFALLQAARAGAGVALAPQFLARGLIRVAADPIPPRQCWLVSHADAKRSPCKRRVIAWLEQSLRQALRS